MSTISFSLFFEIYLKLFFVLFSIFFSFSRSLIFAWLQKPKNAPFDFAPVSSPFFDHWQQQHLAICQLFSSSSFTIHFPQLRLDVLLIFTQFIIWLLIMIFSYFIFVFFIFSSLSDANYIMTATIQVNMVPVIR